MCRRTIAAALMLGMLIGSAGDAELPDPTRPARSQRQPTSTTRSSENGLTLSAVMLSGQRRVAIINGRSVQPGDRVFGARVVEISLSGVRLRRPDGEILLTLTRTGMKRPSRKRGNRR